ncbi:hypothetical protein [Thermophilibacter sp.]
MGDAIVVALGALIGVLGSFPPAVLFEGALRRSAHVNLAAGIVSIAISFLTLLAALFIGYVLNPDVFEAFAVALVASFLAFWGVEAVRGWRAANDRA